MSTDMKTRLKTADQQLNELERKLPLFQRLRRRYLTGRMLVVSQLFEQKGRAEGFLFAGALVGKSFWTGLATKFPVVAGIVIAAWDHITEFLEALLLAFSMSD